MSYSIVFLNATELLWDALPGGVSTEVNYITVCLDKMLLVT